MLWLSFGLSTVYQPWCEPVSVWDISIHTGERSKFKSSVQNLRLSLHERHQFSDEDLCAAAATGLVKQTYMWLKRLSITPKIMCTIPMTTDIFIL